MWSSVHSYDVHFHLNAAIDPNTCFDVPDTTLYTTLLDSSAIRKDSKFCQCCKSPDNLVPDCPFPWNPRWRKIKTRRAALSRQNTWKFEEWFTDTRSECCNLFQHNACQQGKESKWAHVCKACWGDHALANCKFLTSGLRLTWYLGLTIWWTTLTELLLMNYYVTLPTVYILASKVNNGNKSLTMIFRQFLILRPSPTN